MPQEQRCRKTSREVSGLTVFYILLSILLFGVLILVHEFGHFICAKLFGVQVNEFSLFMGPAIWKKKKGETLYVLRCIPIGGYCAMEGEDSESENPRAFGNAKVWKRFLILIAGSFMNLLLGLLITVIFTSVYFDDALPTARIVSFMDDCPYESETGFQTGDELYSIDGERVYILNDFSLLMERNGTQVYDIVVLRDGEKVELNDFTLKKLDYDGVQRYGLTFRYEEKTLGSVLSYSWNQSRDFARLVRMGLQDLLTGKAGLSEMGGPVLIVQTVTQAGVASKDVGLGILNVLYFFAFIAINLGIMNLLPIPALDGGRVVCLLVTAAAEKILRRKINPKYEGYLHAVFMILLLIFMALITFKDIFRLFGG